jgi:tryptophan-rich sensory protein
MCNFLQILCALLCVVAATNLFKTVSEVATGQTRPMVLWISPGIYLPTIVSKGLLDELKIEYQEYFCKK